MTVPRRFRHVGLVLVRATTFPSESPAEVPVPHGLDLADPIAMSTEGRAWLRQVWAHRQLREAVAMASPVLAARLDHLIADGDVPERRLRRAVTSLVSYLLRWERRATPFGAFAGVATASLGPAEAKFGSHHRLVLRADAEWVTSLINRVEADHALRWRLTVVTDNTAVVRDGCVLVSRRAEVGSRSPGPLRETSARFTPAVSYTLDQATVPVRLDVLAERLQERFPRVAAERIHLLLHSLIDGGYLITSLRPPTTAPDPLRHLIDALGRAVHQSAVPEADEAPGTAAELLAGLENVSTCITWHNTATDEVQATKLRSQIIATMRDLVPGIGVPLAADLRLDAHLTLPDQVVQEAERAADVLLRLTAQPFGTAAWMDYHTRFRARYGTGALVGVRDLVADSGLGYPHGFLGAPRARPAWRTLTERDAVLLALIQQAVIDNTDEITLTDSDIRALTVGDHTDVAVPPRVELGVTLHAASAEAIDRGDFELRVVAAPRAHTSIVGRFSPLLDNDGHARLAATYDTHGEAVVAQLSFAPRRPHNDNVVRVPAPAHGFVLPLAEHSCAPAAAAARPGHGVITLEDLAVTADDAHLYLVQRSTGRRVLAHLAHALDTTAQMPPLARFLAEVADARSAVFGPLILGAARTLPFVPRIRYRRTVLFCARWLLQREDLPADSVQWDARLSHWRARWRVPAHVVLCQGDLRLPLDLDQVLDRRLLCARLERTDQLELREGTPPAAQGWVERATELVIPMVSSERHRPPPPASPPATAQQPGQGALLCARLVGHPARFDTIVTRHLPAFVKGLGNRDVPGDHGAPVQRWWVRRHRDLIRVEADQYLVVTLRLADPSQYGPVAARLADFATDLQARGLLEHLTLAPAIHRPGRYGNGPAWEAAEQVFAADTTAVIAQLAMAEASGVPGQAIAAASMTHLAAAFGDAPSAGYQALTSLGQGSGTLDPVVRDHAVAFADAVDGSAAVRVLPGGEAVAASWQTRTAALVPYHRVLSVQRDPVSVLPILLHDHHVRMFGLDAEHEATVVRCARAAALRNLALERVR